jgi:hypothetical protein
MEKPTKSATPQYETAKSLNISARLPIVASVACTTIKTKNRAKIFLLLYVGVHRAADMPRLVNFCSTTLLSVIYYHLRQVAYALWYRR